MLTLRQRESLRKSFLPPNIHILFIGESPPASGRFFYSANSGLYRAMRAAFQQADPSITSQSFLQTFGARGCYLIDLSLVPVDHLDPPQRRTLLIKGERRLAETIERLQPAILAPVLRSIVGHVTNAAARARWHGQTIELPYPGRWSKHRDAFIAALVPIIQRL